jgi:hypothetical protein
MEDLGETKTSKGKISRIEFKKNSLFAFLSHTKMNPNENVLRIDLVNSLTQREIDYLRNYVPEYYELLYAQTLPSFENLSEDGLGSAIEYLTDDKIDLLDTLTTNDLTTLMKFQSIINSL